MFVACFQYFLSRISNFVSNIILLCGKLLILSKTPEVQTFLDLFVSISILDSYTRQYLLCCKASNVYFGIILLLHEFTKDEKKIIIEEKLLFLTASILIKAY